MVEVLGVVLFGCVMFCLAWIFRILLKLSNCLLIDGLLANINIASLIDNFYLLSAFAIMVVFSVN